MRVLSHSLARSLSRLALSALLLLSACAKASALASIDALTEAAADAPDPGPKEETDQGARCPPGTRCA